MSNKAMTIHFYIVEEKTSIKVAAYFFCHFNFATLLPHFAAAWVVNLHRILKPVG